MTQPARRQASHADQARRADATAASARPHRPPAHAIAAEAARKAPKCPACLLAHAVLHPHGWAKQGGAADTKWHLEGETLRERTG
jgi:hypothetical protein